MLRIEEVVSWISEQRVVADFSEASAQKNLRIGLDWQETDESALFGLENNYVAVVEQLSMSQETAPGSHRTVRQIAREVGISKAMVHRPNIVRQDLTLKCSRKSRAQE